jgi:hypothetical protein
LPRAKLKAKQLGKTFSFASGSVGGEILCFPVVNLQVKFFNFDLTKMKDKT